MSESSNVRVSTGWQRPSPVVLEAFSHFQVANIGDALERLGFTDGGISGIWSGARAVGSALPVLTVAGDNKAVIEALNHIHPGDLVAINSFGFNGRAINGDNLAQRFDVLRATGALVDGYVRDKVIIERLGFPVFARGVTPAGPFKNGPGTIGEPVAIGGVVVIAGDIICADEDGVIIVTLHRAEEVILAVAEIGALEASKDAEVEQMKFQSVQ